MSEIMESHVPSAAFRATLEDEIVRTWRRESRLAASPRGLGRRGMRSISLLVAGLVLGFSTEFASGQVRDAQERNRLLEAAMESRQLAALRLSLAEEAYKQARQRFDVGAINRESLLDAEREMDDLRVRVTRMDLDVMEIRATAAPPRDELWAPLVDGRDYVSDRIKVEAQSLQEKLRAAEARVDELGRAQRLGAAREGAVAAANADLETARRDLELAAMKLQLRKQCLEQGLSSEEATRRYQRFELMTEIDLAQRALKRAQDRVALVRERVRVGAADELEVKRAEIEALELSSKLKMLGLQLQRMGKPEEDSPGR